MILHVTISDDQGLVKGQYKVTSDEPDTIEEMDALRAQDLEDRDTILDTIKHDLGVYFAGGS